MSILLARERPEETNENKFPKPGFLPITLCGPDENDLELYIVPREDQSNAEIEFGSSMPIQGSGVAQDVTEATAAGRSACLRDLRTDGLCEAQELLEAIYRPYERSMAVLDWQTQASLYFAPFLARLITQDKMQAKNGQREIERLDFDPFIAGQDWKPVRIQLQVLTGEGPDQALGIASFTPEGAHKPSVTMLDLMRWVANYRHPLARSIRIARANSVQMSWCPTSSDSCRSSRSIILMPLLVALIETISVMPVQATGALAVDSAQGSKWGASWNHANRATASQGALSKCGANCRVVLFYQNGCGAWAADQTAGSTVFGWGLRGALSAAQDEALRQCWRRGGRACSVRAWGCDNR